MQINYHSYGNIFSLSSIPRILLFSFTLSLEPPVTLNNYCIAINELKMFITMHFLILLYI